MKNLGLILLIAGLLSSCNLSNKKDKAEQSIETTSHQKNTSEEEYIDDDYIGDEEKEATSWEQ